jgi:hypothetical protein
VRGWQLYMRLHVRRSGGSVGAGAEILTYGFKLKSCEDFRSSVLMQTPRGSRAIQVFFSFNF